MTKISDDCANAERAQLIMARLTVLAAERIEWQSSHRSSGAAELPAPPRLRWIFSLISDPLKTTTSWYRKKRPCSLERATIRGVQSKTLFIMLTFTAFPATGHPLHSASAGSYPIEVCRAQTWDVDVEHQPCIATSQMRGAGVRTGSDACLSSEALRSGGAQSAGTYYRGTLQRTALSQR